MRRFLIGFSAAFVAMFLGNIGGLILLWFWIGREVNYDMPGGVLLGFAQAYVAICLAQFFCERYCDRDLAHGIIVLSSIVLAFISIIGIIAGIFIERNFPTWAILSTMAYAAPWIYFAKSRTLPI